MDTVRHIRGVKKVKLRAFSVIELMITVIVVGLLMIAFIPTIAKKMANFGIDVGPEIAKNDSCKKFGDGCIECNDVHCTYVATTNYLKEGKAYACSESKYEGMEGCATCENERECLTCIAGYKLNESKKKCESCDAGTYSNVGETSCTPCKVNKFSPEKAHQCTPCPENEYLCVENNKTAGSCLSCSEKIAACEKCKCKNDDTVECSACILPCALNNNSCNCPPAILKSGDSWFSLAPISKIDVSSIEFTDYFNSDEEKYESSWEASSDDSKAKIRAYAIKDEDNAHMYKVIVVPENKFISIQAAVDSSEVFKGFLNVKSIQFSKVFDTKEVKNMQSMFKEAGYKASKFEITGLQNWNVSNVTDMSSMFKEAGYSASKFEITGLQNWIVSNVTNMSSMFEAVGHDATESWKINTLNNWNTQNVTDMSSMFKEAGYSANNFALNLANWNTQNVTNMSSMFEAVGHDATESWTIGTLDNWNTRKVTDMSSMFKEAGYSTTLPWGGSYSPGLLEPNGLFKWNTFNVTDMSSMFENAGYSASEFILGNIGNWNTRDVTDMSSMFENAGYSASKFILGNIGNWNTRNVTDMSSMFKGAGWSVKEIKNWLIGDGTNKLVWDTENVANMSSMFENAGYSLVNFKLTLTNEISTWKDVNWDTRNVTNMRKMFSRDNNGICSESQTYIKGLEILNTSRVDDMGHMFQCVQVPNICSNNINNTTYIGFKNWNVSNLKNATGMFKSFNSDLNLCLDLSGWDTSSIIDASGMFQKAGYNATKINLNFYQDSDKHWKMTNLVNAESMFEQTGYNATPNINFNITGINNWTPHNINNISRMFYKAGNACLNNGCALIDIATTYFWKNTICNYSNITYYDYNTRSIFKSICNSKWRQSM